MNSRQMSMTSFAEERERKKVCVAMEHRLSLSVSSHSCCPVPFLPVREEFHPKRNQARQKLATLPTSRFEDLSSDVYFELVRRYPEFQEEVRPACHMSICDALLMNVV